MRKIPSSFIQLKPAHHTVICQILRDARFWYSQVLGEPRLDGIRTSAVAAAH